MPSERDIRVCGPISEAERFALDSDGFACVRVSDEPEIWRVELLMERTFLPTVNVHVVRDSDDVLIVDTGTSDDYNDTRLMRALVRLGVNPTRVTVFVTHSHEDHAGLARELADAGARILMGEQALADLRAFAAPEYRDFLAGRLASEGFAPDVALDLANTMWTTRSGSMLDGVSVKTVQPGDHVRCGRWDFEVVGTPGHTPGHCVLWHPGLGIAFTGDALLFACSTFICFWKDTPDALGLHLQSLRKLGELGIQRAFLGHGEQEGSIAERAEANIAHHERRSARAIKAIREQPGRCACELFRDLGWHAIGAGGLDAVPLLTRWFIAAESIANLDHLVQAGSIRRVSDASGVARYYPE